MGSIKTLSRKSSFDSYESLPKGKMMWQRQSSKLYSSSKDLKQIKNSNQ
jgi:hypothetical protein